ncbi:MAG: response regulator [Deltaproteobacteria bacterium]|nr:response regulator [Deltaproteobacteria bacterium]
MRDGPAADAAPRAHLLVVDDERGIRDLLAYELGYQGYAVVTAENGAEGLAWADRQHFDLALCDVMLPGTTGPDILRGLRQRQPELQVVMVTGYPNSQVALECLRLGAFHYLGKPFLHDELSLVLARALERAELEAALRVQAEWARIATALSPWARVERLVDEAPRWLHSDGVALVRPGSGGTWELLRSAPNGRGPEPRQWLGLAEATARHTDHAPFVVPEISACPAAIGAPEPPLEGGALVQSLRGPDWEIGRLLVWRGPGRIRFSTHDARQVRSLGSALALAVDNATLYSALTERMTTLNNLHDRLARAERLAAMARLANGVAHEINNPLGVIELQLSALEEHVEVYRRLWGLSRRAAERLALLPDDASRELAAALSAVGTPSGVSEALLGEDAEGCVRACRESARRIASVAHSFHDFAAGSPAGTRAVVDLCEVVPEALTRAGLSAAACRLEDQSSGAVLVRAEASEVRRALAEIFGFLLRWGAARGLDPSHVGVVVSASQEVSTLRCEHRALFVEPQARSRLLEPGLEMSGPRVEGPVRLDLSLGLAAHLLQANGMQLSVDVQPEAPLRFLVQWQSREIVP